MKGTGEGSEKGMRHGREEEGEGQVSRASQAGKQFVRQTAYQDLGFKFLSQGKAGQCNRKALLDRSEGRAGHGMAWHGRAGQGRALQKQLPGSCRTTA